MLCDSLLNPKDLAIDSARLRLPFRPTLPSFPLTGRKEGKVGRNYIRTFHDSVTRERTVRANFALTNERRQMEMQKDIFPVLGMSCAACAARVDKTLRSQPGVKDASVNYAAATATVAYDPALCSPQALKAAVVEAGYDLVVDKGADVEKEVEDEEDVRRRDC